MLSMTKVKMLSALTSPKTRQLSKPRTDSKRLRLPQPVVVAAAVEQMLKSMVSLSLLCLTLVKKQPEEVKMTKKSSLHVDGL